MLAFAETQCNHNLAERENMARRTIVPFLVIFLIIGMISFDISMNNVGALQAQPKGKTHNRFEFFAGSGFFYPSLKGWNDQVKQFNNQLLESGAANLHNFLIVKNDELVNLEQGYWDLGGYSSQGSQKYLSSDLVTSLGVRYYFTTRLNLAFTVGKFSTSSNSQFSASNGGKESDWPNYAYQVSDQIVVSQSIEIYPTMLSLNFNLPFDRWSKNFELYSGIGVGFNFSKVKTEIIDSYTMNQLNGDAPWDSVSFSQNPLTMDILSNVQAKANPLSLQASIGTNLKFGIVLINFEAGYNFSKARFDEADWKFFTRKFTPRVKIEGRQAPDYEVKYIEKRKYYFDTPESAYENLKLKQIDYSGFIFKGSIGLTF